MVAYECARVLKPGGIGIFSAPWKYMDHPDPIDCWRISPDGMRGLVEGWFDELVCKKVAGENITVTLYAGRRNKK